MSTTANQGALDERKTMAYSAAAIFAGAIVVAAVETALPGDPENTLLPGIVALLMAPLAVIAGPRLPRRVLAAFAPIGVACIAYALATTSGGPTDGAVLYMWPVLWMSYFYGRAGAVFIVAFVALAQGLALLSMPAGQVSADRWIDVLVSVAVVASVVHYLASRNSRLVTDLEEQARLDPLTGLLNRRGLDERMDIEITRGLRGESHMAVAMLDIDHFKTVNDEHGHEIGDRVLAWIGTVLARQTRGTDVAARTGGDEFVVLLPETDATAGRQFADRVRETLAGTDSLAERRHHGLPDSVELTVSVGVSGASARKAETLVDAADRALYLAKGEGRNRVVVADYDQLRRTPV